MKSFKVAIVTPVYNGELTIEKSLSSLLNQTFKNWISIIVNDGSTDKTSKVLQKYVKDERFIIIDLKKNVGRGEARKIALKKVKELNVNYMCMLDADDFYYEDKLEWQINYMENNKDISLMSCSIGYVDNDNRLLGVLEPFSYDNTLSFSNYIDYKAVPHACSIIRVDQIGQITFDEKLTLGQDQDFMIRMLINKKYAFIPKLGYLYNRTDSFSFDKYKKSILLSYYSKQKLNLPTKHLFKIKLTNYFKIFIVWLLTLFNKQELYLDRIGRKPNEKELERHNKFLNES